VGARSIAPGTVGNLSQDSLVAIEGELGLEASVTNPYATHGGTNAFVPTPTMQDLRLLQESLVDKLKQAALLELQSNLASGDTMISPSLKSVEVLDKTISPAVGEPGRELNLSLRLRFQSQVVKVEVLNNLVAPILDANIHPGYSPIDNTMWLTLISPPMIGVDGNAHWTVQAQRKLKADIPADQSINLINGLSIPQAQELLEHSLPLAEQAQIRLSPNWWPRLPFLPMRIQLSQPES
jgi:hypothetical protein